MTEPTHRVRPHLFTNEQSYALERDALVFRAGGKTKSIPYSDIKSVRVLSYANVGEIHYLCIVKTRSFGKFKIRSHSYQPSGECEDRTKTYFSLVRDLCRYVRAGNPDARFVNGSRWIQSLWLVVLVFAALGWVMLVLMLLGGADLQEAATLFVLLSFMTALGGRWFSANKPELFDPMEPPLA